MDDSSRLIPLLAKDGSIRGYAKVDAQDFDWLSQWTWRLASTGYAERGVRDGGGYRKVQMHREVVGSEAEGLQVDHINRDRADNRRSNLRVVTPAQQAQNQTPRARRSAYRGVTEIRQGSYWRWVARVQVGGQRRYLGVFTTEQAARDACVAARRELMPYAVD